MRLVRPEWPGRQAHGCAAAAGVAGAGRKVDPSAVTFPASMRQSLSPSNWDSEEETVDQAGEASMSARRQTYKQQLPPSLGGENQDYEEFPNMLFVPLKAKQAAVDRRQMLIYLCMLSCFLYNIRTQHFTEDFKTNVGLQSMVDITQFNKIKTVNDYYAWHPKLLVAMNEWQLNRDEYQDIREISDWPDDLRTAVLVGWPKFQQDRRCPPTVGVELTDSCTLPFNPPADLPCPWPLQLQNATSSCYTDTETLTNPITRRAAPVYKLPAERAAQIIRGNITWSPSNWIDTRYTNTLSHEFTVYIPASRRFAVGRLELDLSPTGQVVRSSEFVTHEPFLLDTNPFNWGIEFVFYIVVFYFLMIEMAEIWDCVCSAELIIPIEIIAITLQLRLIEVQYYHEKSRDVYDPRHPETGETFIFPDKEDSKRGSRNQSLTPVFSRLYQHGAEISLQCCCVAVELHLTECIEPLQKRLVQTTLKIRDLKLQLSYMGGSSGVSASDAEQLLQVSHDTMRKLQVQFCQQEVALIKELHIAEIAAILQLSVMWKNKWSDDFEGTYLAELNNSNEEVGEDDFTGVNWIEVGRQYVHWAAYGDGVFL